MANWFTSFINFVRLLTVEPLAFLTIFIYLFKRLPQDQLTQDKICLQRYNLPEDYCQRLPTMKDEEDTVYHMKSTILGDVTQFNLYINVLITIPIVLISIMIGPFIDKYKPAKRILLIISSLVSLLECIILVCNSYFFSTSYYLLLVSHVVNASCGGPLVALTTIWAYLSSVTPPHMRSLRMTTIEIFIATSSPIATAAGGNLLNFKTPFVGHEPRNFTTIFLIGCACSILSLLISILLVDEDKDKELFAVYFPAESTSGYGKNAQIREKKMIEDESTSKANEDQRSAIRILFDLNNVKEMFHTFTKPRPHNIRMHIILIILASMSLLLAYLGPAVFLYQYVQKLFSWNSSSYSNYVTVTSIINIFSTFALAPVLINVFKLADLHYSLISFHCMLMQNILRLLSKSVWAFYLAAPFYVLNSLGMVGIRSYLTKIVEPNELGRVFSLMSAIDALIPVMSSLIFTPLFRLTIDSIPNLSFSAVCVGLGAGIACIYVVASQSKKTLQMIENDKNNCLEKTHESPVV